MTLAQWEKQYYPITAEVAAKQGQLVALKHSLRKWQGLVNITAPLELVGQQLVEGDRIDPKALLPIDYKSCALCSIADGECSNCILYEVTGRGCEVEYGEFVEQGDVKPMLSLLEKALAYLRKRK